MRQKRESTDSSDLDCEESKRQRSEETNDVGGVNAKRVTEGDDTEEHDGAGGIDCLPSMDEIHKAVEDTTQRRHSATAGDQSMTVEDVTEDEFDMSEDAKQRFKNECLYGSDQVEETASGHLAPRSSVFQTTEASRAKVQNKREKAGYRTKSAFGTTIFVETDPDDEEAMEEHHEREGETVPRKSYYVRRRPSENGSQNEAAQHLVANTNATVANVLKDMEAVKKSAQPSATLRKARAIQRVAKRNAALHHSEDSLEQSNSEEKEHEIELDENENSQEISKLASPTKQTEANRVSNGAEFSRRILQSKTNNTKKGE